MSRKVFMAAVLQFAVLTWAALLPWAALQWASLPVMAQSSADMIPLTDEPSRGDLFAAYLVPKAGYEALPKLFTFPKDTEFEAADKPRKDAVFGVDISHHNESRCQCKIDWTTFRGDKVHYVFLKASQGARYFDPTFARNWAAIAALPSDKKLYRGAYHFLSADVDAVAQARHFLAIAPKPGPDDMAPTLDLEWDNRKGPDGKTYDAWSRVSKGDIVTAALVWLKEVKTATGKTPLIYTNRAWWSERIGEDRVAEFDGYPIWIADYSAGRLATEKPAVMKARDWTLWQFSEDARLPINGKLSQVDVNVFKGPMDKLKSSLGIAD